MSGRNTATQILKTSGSSYALPFHVPHRARRQAAYVAEALRHGHLRPDGPFFQRAQVLIWSRFKAIMEAHVASLAAAANLFHGQTARQSSQP